MSIKNMEYIKDKYTWKDLIAVVHKLRQPDGCSWDSTQTYESMCKCVLDEANEVVEAVQNKDYINLREELGDLLLQVVMYSDMAADRGDFTLEDVIDELAKKMVRRHPNVFGDETAISEELSDITQQGVSRWNAIKLKEKINRLEEYKKLHKEGRITVEQLKVQQDKLEDFKRKIGIFNKN